MNGALVRLAFFDSLSPIGGEGQGEMATFEL
jgi:hypothetical protein